MSDNNEPLDLQKIEARLAKATPGPWQAEDLPYNGIDDPMIVSVGGVFIAQTVYDMQSITQEHDVDADTIFIANAPTDVAALVREVKRLRREINQRWKYDREAFSMNGLFFPPYPDEVEE